MKLSAGTPPKAKKWASVASIVTGVLLLQLAWQLTVPAFRGIDEIDHAYRAATVMEGHIAPSRQYAGDGRGLVVRVPAHLVTAAAPACAALIYVGPDNCVAMTPVDPDGEVEIATAAAEYPPIYYAAVGWPLFAADGETALYLMRLFSSVLIALLIGVSVFIAVSRKRIWLLLGIILCLTPTLLYASVVVAPNGLAMAGGLLMWTSWLSVDSERPLGTPRLLLVGAIGACFTMIGHNTGFVWVATTMVIFVFLWWPIRLSRTGIGVLLPALLSIAAVGVAMFGWMLFSGATVPRGKAGTDVTVASAAELLAFPLLWLFQSFFSAPRAGGFSHPALYAIAISTLLVFCASGFRRAGPRVRIAGVGVVLVVTVVPLLLTWATQDIVGLAWQGRYALPLSVGIVLLAAAALDRTTPFRCFHFLYLPSVLLISVIGFVSARANVGSEGAAFLTPSWVAPVLAMLAVGAFWRGIGITRADANFNKHAELPQGSRISESSHDMDPSS